MISFARVPVVVAAVLLTASCAAGGGEATVPPAASSLPPLVESAVPEPSPSPESSSSSTSSAEETASTPEATRTTRSNDAEASGVFSGKRQVNLLPKNSEATLGVVADNKIGLSSKFGDNELFVLTPDGDAFQIRTGKVRSGGEALCLSAKLGEGGRPAAVRAVGCDASAGDQRFLFRRSGDSNGKPTYTIRTGTNTFIVQDPTGEIAGTGVGVAAVAIGEGTPDIDTPFLVVDKGRATLPALD